VSSPDRFPPHVVALVDQDLANAGRTVERAMQIYLDAREECGTTGALLDLIGVIGELSEPAIVGAAAAAIVRLVNEQERRR
jgi:hypothetical protein